MSDNPERFPHEEHPRPGYGAWPGPQPGPPPGPPPGPYPGPPPGQGYQGYPPQGGWPYGHQGYGVPGYGGYGGQGPRPGTDDTTMAMLAHLLGLLTSFVGPLVLYLAKRDEAPYVRAQAAEALNFQLTLMIAYLVSWVLAFVLIGFLLMPLVWIGSLILMIIAAVAANRGESYRYPLNIRFVS
ncbi:DUF4870 domain-containing protein [Streptosporangium sp. NPDC000239]|uniref:DUF4870 domain-containing protein n=1 Tax=unclassified Streptosporangium TaxID=2632669 RepID=UPI00332CC1F8